MNANGHQTSGQAEQQNGLLGNLVNDSTRQGENIGHCANNCFHTSFSYLSRTLAKSKKHRLLVATPFLKNFM